MATINEVIALLPNAEQADTRNILLAAIAGQSGGIALKSFGDIQMLNRLGLASKVLVPGDPITVEKETGMTVTTSGSISGATVHEDEFLDTMDEAHEGVYEFMYDGAVWQLNGAGVELQNYGITVTGTPAEGDTIVVHEATQTITFEVADFDKHTPADSKLKHSISLLCREAVASFAYNPTQAVITVKTGTLPAGTYALGVNANYDPSYNSHEQGGYLTFTLSQDVPEGGQIMLGWGYNAQLANSKMSTYPKFGTTAIESNISVSMSEVIDTGVQELGTLTNGEVTTKTLTNDAVILCNNAARARYGSNDVRSSAMLQWLSSDAASGWHQQVSPFDRPQTTPTAGFLHGIDPAFKKILGKVKLRSAFNTVCKSLLEPGDTTATYYDGEYLGWLPSMTELGWGNNNNVAEGSLDAGGNMGTAAEETFALFDGATNADRIRRNNATARHWWLRSPHPSFAHIERLVDTDGSLYSYYLASHGYWAVPGLDII